MEQKIKIAVIGGTGKSGKYLVNELLSQGFNLKVLLRDPNSFQIENLLIEIVEGDITNLETAKTLVKDCCAVISTLGWGQGNNKSSLFSTASKNIIEAMNKFGIKRYIVVSGLNVDTIYDQKSTKVKAATQWMYENYPEATANRQNEYNVLTESNLDWTMVRLPLIEQTDQLGDTKISLVDCLGDKISATSLAHFLIKQINDYEYIKRAPFISD